MLKGKGGRLRCGVQAVCVVLAVERGVAWRGTSSGGWRRQRGARRRQARCLCVNNLNSVNEVCSRILLQFYTRACVEGSSVPARLSDAADVQLSIQR